MTEYIPEHLRPLTPAQREAVREASKRTAALAPPLTEKVKAELRILLRRRKEDLDPQVPQPRAEVDADKAATDAGSAA